MPSTLLPTVAVLTVTFLSGASLSNSWFSLPFLLTTLTPSTIPATLHTFALLQAHADPIFPLIAVTTSLLHWTHAYRLHFASGTVWAGAATFCMITYSLAVVFPTVGKIEKVQSRVERNKADRDNESGKVEAEEMRALLRRWNVQHIVRGLMPLVGTVVGLRALVRELGGGDGM
ncbi:hypothetical protein P171DRAFT_482485 [Karstenula rhodostoma CBS 690.94]|uniref:DUF1772-domain-containing protein n=1 Tax=Karstenula rhodostoma CBS 690.94 TaxID=1392251 RepID=A0A9P4PMD0_9PLEO|nr:hypothetical protein P171DRAFT_482485 [Karstenula rhodostoma CBS 690.94]